jgi:aromatic aminotransferase
VQVSKRVLSTDEPCIAKTKKLMKGVEDAVSLAQGVVHWPPPERAVQAAIQVANTPAAHAYGPTIGMPELRHALQDKVSAENGLANVWT